MRGSIARRTGLTFLVVSLILGVSIPLTIALNLQVWSSNVALLGESGALHIYVVRGVDYSSVAGYRISAPSLSTWNWRTALWPTHHYYDKRPGGGEKDHVSIPLWMPLSASALASWLSFLVAERLRRKIGCCKNCGYNLTGNTTGVCPECGTAAPIETNDHADHP